MENDGLIRFVIILRTDPHEGFPSCILAEIGRPEL